MAQTRSVGSTDAPVSSRSGKPSTNRGGKSTAAGRGAKPSSGNKGGNPAVSVPQISQAALATYKHVQQQLEAQKKAAKEAEDAGEYFSYYSCLSFFITVLSVIRARNKELMDAEGNQSGEEDNAPTQKRKKTSVSAIIALSDDEEELASAIGSIRAAALGTRAEDDDLIEDDDTAPRNAGEDEDLHAELNGVDVDEIDVEMDFGSGDGDLSNEVCFNIFHSLC